MLESPTRMTQLNRFYLRTLLFLKVFSVLKLEAVENQQSLTEISVAQSQLYYNRIQGSKFINGPYKDLKSSQMCTGTSMGFSSNSNDYRKWQAIYTDCIYVDGNIEINSFAPYNETEGRTTKSEYAITTDIEYDFSFLDNIREITGYLLIHNNKYLKNLKFKNLQIIRGESLLFDRLSLYVEDNELLETLDLSSLKEIQKGAVFIHKNPRLCHMSDVRWDDLLAEASKDNIIISDNADSSKCPSCANTCRNGTSNFVGCWSPTGCQKLTKIVCDARCEGARCFGPGPYDCCNSQCLGGCDGPMKTQCVACTKLRIKTTGECVETCPRVETFSSSGELIYNPKGMYQYGITCVKSCPKKSFIYKEYCLKNCPNNTYEESMLVQNPETGEKGMRRFCKDCTADKCTKSCSIEGELNMSQIKNLEGCHVLKGNLIISKADVSSEHQGVSGIPNELTEEHLQVLSSLKIVNGFVRIQRHDLTNLSFLRNLEVIRANELLLTRYSMLIISDSLKTLNFNKLKRIENGLVQIYTKHLCLFDTINWNQILPSPNALIISKSSREYAVKNCARDGYSCDSTCAGCWSTGPKSCQICKTYKLDDTCIESCNNTQINGKFTYVDNQVTRECAYCHEQCHSGCTGPSEYECTTCASYFLKANRTHTKCVDKCPISHYVNPANGRECLPCYKDCYGCTGPKDTLTVGGCSQCSSAIVGNDADYSVLKCVEREALNCSLGQNEFPMLVPEALEHPLRGKKVCRKCHDQCDGCIDNGVRLGTQCRQCRNYLSDYTGECVKNCSFDREYLQRDTKICLACHSECKLGCHGSGNFECQQCRTYQLKLADAESLIVAFAAESTYLGGPSFADLSVAAKVKYLEELATEHGADKGSKFIQSRIEIIMNVRQFYYNRYQAINNTVFTSGDDAAAVFCVSACPQEFPYKNDDNFCTANATSIKFEFVFFFLVLILVTLFVTFIAIISVWQRRIKIRQLERENEEKFFSPDFDKETDNGPYSDKVNMSTLRLIKLNELELGKVLGRGAFGTVYEGFYRPFDDNDDQNNCKVKVAIKVLNKQKVSDEKAVSRLSEELINEAKVMASVDHEYCLRLTALCLAEPMMMVTQLMQHGSVVSFYQKYRDICTEKMLLTWAKQIAEGMSYLESRGIVHRDLAARNILVKKFDQIKITDFGLARVLDSRQEGIYVLEYSLVPFKWLAIESIRNRLFNHKSDVWSYGICLWEIFTFCSKPYAEYPETDSLTIFNCILKGTRLAKPQMASLDVYTILLRCWLENPMARPDFKTLADEFSKMCMDPKRYLSIDKENYNHPFRTIDDNTQYLLHEFEFDTADLSPRSSQSNSDKHSDKSLSKEDYIDVETASSGFGDGVSSSNNEKLLDTKKSDTTILNKHAVKTFKRTGQPIASNNNLNIPRRQTIDIANTQASPPRPPTTKASPSTNNNKKRIRKLFSFNQKPKRLDSEISTGTNSTYLSYSSYSSVSSPSPRQIYKDNNKNNLNFNFYDEQEELLNNTNTSYGFSSATASRSNSNSTHSTNSSELLPSCHTYDSNRYSSVYKNQRSTGNQNNDYLEPIMNVMQNFEYFNDNDNNNNIKRDSAKKPPPAIIIMHDTAKPDTATATATVQAAASASNYSNEIMSNLLKKKTGHIKTTDI